MTSVVFYSLADRDDNARMRFACRLSRRGLQARLNVYLRTPNPAASENLDQLMWEYPLARFLPHAIAGTPESRNCRIIIGHEPVTDVENGLLINLTDSIPEDWQRFERVAEIVIAPSKAEGRERYKQYRELGCSLEHHDPYDWE